MNSRTKFSAFVIAMVLFTMSLTIEGQSQEGRSIRKALEGSWRVSANLGPNRPPAFPATVEGLATYDAGGGYMFSDNQITSPTPAHGSWEFAGHGRFNARRLKFIMNPQGQLVSILHIRSRITLNFTNDEYTSEESVEVRQFPGGTLVAAYDGASSVGKRILVEPLD
jgi:hypothetical protein